MVSGDEACLFIGHVKNFVLNSVDFKILCQYLEKNPEDNTQQQPLYAAYNLRYYQWAGKIEEKNTPKVVYDDYITGPVEVWSSMEKGSEIKF